MNFHYPSLILKFLSPCLLPLSFPKAGTVVCWIVMSVISILTESHAAIAKIMPLGDSITRGNNDINYPNGDIPGGYRKELGVRLTNGSFEFDFIGNQNDNAAPGMDPDHQGHPGFRTDELLAGLPGWLSAAPDTVLLMAGTNDILENIPVATAAANLDSLILQITAGAPDCRLYVSTIPPITQAWKGQTAAALNTNADLFNTEVRNRVQQHLSDGRNVTLVDASALITLTDPDPLNNFFQPGDGIHPGQAGYNQLAVIWFNAITADGNLIDPPMEGLPAVPSVPAASVVSPSRVNLTWTDNASDEMIYQIRRTTGTTGIWEIIAELPVNASSHAVTGLSAGAETYGFSVRAGNALGYSKWSASVFTPTYVDRAHEKPASASASFSASTLPENANDGTLTTLWASTGAASHYWQVDLTDFHHLQKVTLVTRQDSNVETQRKNFEVRASNDPSFASYIVLGSQGATALPFKGTWTRDIPTTAPLRYVRVAKTDGTSFSITLLKVNAAALVEVPPAPTGLFASPLDATHVRLAWNVTSDNEAGFKIERKAGEEGVYEEIATIAAATSSFVDSGAAGATTFYYRLRAFNESGDSGYSAEVAASTGTLSAYELWSENFPAFLALDPSLRLPSSDANGDGIVNLLAFAEGRDPMEQTPPDQLASITTLPPGQIVFRFQRNKMAPDISHEVLVSSDLTEGSWTPLSLASATVEDIVESPGVEEVSVPIPPLAGVSQRFARLRVVKD